MVFFDVRHLPHRMFSGKVLIEPAPRAKSDRFFEIFNLHYRQVLLKSFYFI